MFNLLRTIHPFFSERKAICIYFQCRYRLNKQDTEVQLKPKIIIYYYKRNSFEITI